MSDSRQLEGITMTDAAVEGVWREMQRHDRADRLLTAMEIAALCGKSAPDRGANKRVADGFWVYVMGSPARNEDTVRYYYSETAPETHLHANRPDYERLEWHIRNREDGCGIPPCDREEALYRLLEVVE